MRLPALLLLPFLILAAGPALAREFPAAKLPPIDESGRDPGFKAFWAALGEAAKARDVAFLKAHLSPTAKVDFGGGTGWADFARNFALDTDPDHSPLWRELAEIHRLGGTFDTPERTAFTAPYVFNHIPSVFDDTFAAVTGRGVNLRESPGMKSASVATLDFDIVKVLPVDDPPPPATVNGETWPWVKVRTADGKTGWVFGKFVRGACAWRFHVVKVGERWMIDFFVQGD